MRTWTQWLVGVALSLVALPGAARAESDVDILLNKLVEKGTLSGVEAGEIRREIAETKEARYKQMAKELVPDSSRNWQWSGDLRLRNEFRNRSKGTTPGAASGAGTDLTRQRIRFRYGVDAKINDQLKAGARFATGSTADPVSTNQSFNNSFNHMNILLDRAFLSYMPELPGVTETKITGGVMENPFWCAGPMVWDEDLNFTGVAVRLADDVMPELNVFTVGGAFPVQTDVTQQANLWSTQGGIVYKPWATELENELEKNAKLTMALAYHDYQNITGTGENTAVASAGGSAWPAASKGNLANVEDFNLLNPSFDVGSQYVDIPFGLYGDFVHNTAALDVDNGFMVGVRAGKARIPFDLRKGWEGGYFFERLEANATFGPFADSDFGNGGTNHRGHAFWVKLATLKNSVVQLKYFNTQELTGPTKNHVDTFQADWVTKF